MLKRALNANNAQFNHKWELRTWIFEIWLLALKATFNIRFRFIGEGILDGENYWSVVSISKHHGHESNKQIVFQKRVEGIKFEVYFLITNHTSLNYTMFNYHRVEISYKYLSVMTTRLGTAFTGISLVIMVSILFVVPFCKPTFNNSIAHCT